jgi:hypothetical protein
MAPLFVNESIKHFYVRDCITSSAQQHSLSQSVVLVVEVAFSFSLNLILPVADPWQAGHERPRYMAREQKIITKGDRFEKHCLLLERKKEWNGYVFNLLNKNTAVAFRGRQRIYMALFLSKRCGAPATE